MDLSLFDALCSDLTIAADTLKRLYDSNPRTVAGRPGSATLSELDQEILAARRNLSSTASRLQTLVAEPRSFIHRLAIHNQVLACLKWLGEFQVIACVPLSESISIQELADLADVPKSILGRVVRMTATAGFLHEPQPGYVAHTPLSASFITELSYYDAAMFLANTIAPSALHLTLVSQKMDRMPQPAIPPYESSSAYMAALNTPRSFASACAEGAQLNRQWSAYSQSIGSINDMLENLLGVLNWKSLGEATVVHVCARYSESSTALANMSSALRLIVQTYEFTLPRANRSSPGGGELEDLISRRIAIQMRKPTAVQPIKDAAVYILQPSLSPSDLSGFTLHDIIVAELRSHLNILRVNPSALLILVPPLLPEPGSTNIDEEVQARLHDFTSLQLNGESALEVTELIDLVKSVCDQHGIMIATNRLRSLSGATIALAMKYQSYAASSPYIV